MLRFQRFYSSYAQKKVLRKYPVGGIIHGFEVKRTMAVPEFKLTAVGLVHSQTGAEHLHIDRDDKNNSFSIAFKTNPPDATGVPHILEHTTLCGSQKYPVRDPFFKMLNRSLSNFMNAMTGPDYTLFPFSTTNMTDFKNLRDVYIDSTLNPLLKSEDFYQEGWRLEHENVMDSKSDIVFKGVVYNEMKGQISNANYYFWVAYQNSIYPSLNDSGGNPKKITDLYYHELVDFHKTNYHPSNAKTFTYGNFPLDSTLKSLNNAFAGYGKRIKNQTVLLPVELSVPIDVNTEGELDTMLPPDRQLKTSMTWICGSPHDIYETFLLKVLGNLLMDGHSSVFFQRLIESGVGLDFSVNSGFESATAANFLTIGVQGVRDLDQFRTIVIETFQELQATPFDRKKIDAIIQQLELSKKDQKSDFGLQLLYSILPNWSNGVDPFETLQFDDILTRFREELEQHGDKLFQDLLEKYIIGKPSFNFSMEGDADFSKKLEIEESERLKTKIKSLNEDDRKAIYDRGLYLQKKQNSVEDLSSLPSLKLTDIPRVGDTYELDPLAENITCRITDTNGITYLRAKRLLNDSIPLKLYPYLPLFADSLTSLGTSTQDYSDIEDDMKLHTGGVSTHIEVTADPVTCEPRLSLRFDGWSLNSKTDHIFDIWKKLLIETDFKKHSEKIKILIRSLVSSNTASVAESGHSFARGFAAAHISQTKAICENLSGIQQVQFIANLSGMLEDEPAFQEHIVNKLVELKKHLIGSQGLEFFITTDSTVCANETCEKAQRFMRTLPVATNKGGISTTAFPLLSENGTINNTLIDFPFQVSYAAASLHGVSYTHEDGAPLQVLANLLTFKYLHREIREKGGAYGGGAAYSALEGLFNFYSYRDPRPLAALDTFDKSVSFVLNDTNWNNSDLNEAKLTIFQQIDAPVSRKSEGSMFFYSGVTDKMRQTRREQLLDVSVPDIHRVSELYLLNKKPVRAIIGPNINDKYPPSSWAIKKM
ncbi:hypothetical protein HG535_0D05070 [Zygotorulaspora mrakii]|uniref:Presequence protease, mitochondrial n=1 Tax=Zygotorulaspora mrakii TaxID=42260 RepID=A0A7H9B2B7_ZYGMR|nr:uncharacterized protein HG535_0D05070 [Zygotorulaspora mrakii]QLG72798.1 hypothetical protein HG535_0D05070 [Zygotorulaspora mrakii]